eukprot:3928782-Amphidinium_carterae.1
MHRQQGLASFNCGGVTDNKSHPANCSAEVCLVLLDSNLQYRPQLYLALSSAVVEGLHAAAGLEPGLQIEGKAEIHGDLWMQEQVEQGRIRI